MSFSRLFSPILISAFLANLLAVNSRAEGLQRSFRELTVLTYDSLMADGGLGRELVSRFEKRCACTVKVQVVGDAAQMVSRLQLDASREKFQNQVVLGIDQSLWPQLRPLALPWMPRAKFLHSVGEGFVPFDYGVMAFIWSPSWKGFAGKTPEPPRRWRDLLDPKWKKRLLLQDPRTSSPGLGFVMGARAVLQAQVQSYFQSLKTQWLTLAPGWSGSYELFLKDQAPLVWSYTTSQAYHRAKDPKSRFQAIVFEEGNPLQIEGAFLVKKALISTEAQKLAQDFISFLVSREIQELIPSRQWMFPSIAGVELPRNFRELPQPKAELSQMAEVDLKQVLRDWERSIR